MISFQEFLCFSTQVIYPATVNYVSVPRGFVAVGSIFLFLTVFQPRPPGVQASWVGRVSRILMNVRRYILRFPSWPHNIIPGSFTQWAARWSEWYDPALPASDSHSLSMWSLENEASRTCVSILALHYCQANIGVTSPHKSLLLRDGKCVLGLKFTSNLYAGQMHVSSDSQRNSMFVNFEELTLFIEGNNICRDLTLDNVTLGSELPTY